MGREAIGEAEAGRDERRRVGTGGGSMPRSAEVAGTTAAAAAAVETANR